jgi:HSP20 family protein
MSELTLWKKQELDRLRKDLDSLFIRFRRGFGVPRTFVKGVDMLATELSETGDFLVLTARIPGVRPENIKISVTDDTLRLTAESSEDVVEEGANFHKIIKSDRSFSRTISLPCRIVTEDVKATYKDNVLKIELPKCRPKQARGVNVEVE